MEPHERRALIDKVTRPPTVACKGRPNGVACMVIIPASKESGLCYGCERDLWRMKSR